MPYILDKKYNSLGRLEKWDEVTQGVIRKRLKKELGEISGFQYLSDEEGEVLEIVADVLIPQKKSGERVKIAESIDRNLSDKKIGVRYGENPWKGQFYKQGLQKIKEAARQKYARPIENMNYQELNEFVKEIMEKDGADFLHRFLKKVLSDAIEIYFSHPTAWNQVGFPGPAYPEGYSNLDCGEKDSWEPEYQEASD